MRKFESVCLCVQYVGRRIFAVRSNKMKPPLPLPLILLLLLIGYVSCASKIGRTGGKNEDLIRTPNNVTVIIDRLPESNQRKIRRDVDSHELVKRCGRFLTGAAKILCIKGNKENKHFENWTENPIYVPKKFRNETKYGTFINNPIYQPPSVPLTKQEKSRFLGLNSHYVGKRGGKKIKEVMKKIKDKIPDFRRNRGGEYERLITESPNSIVRFEAPTYESEEYDDGGETNGRNLDTADDSGSDSDEDENPSSVLLLQKEKGRGRLRTAMQKLSALKKFKKKRDKRMFRNRISLLEDETYKPPSNLTQGQNRTRLAGNGQQKRGLGKKLKALLKKMKKKKNKKRKNSRESLESEESEERYDSGYDSADGGESDDSYDDSGYEGDDEDSDDSDYRGSRVRNKRGDEEVMERVLRSMAVFTSRLLGEGKDTSITTTLDTKDQDTKPVDEGDVAEEEDQYENQEKENVYVTPENDVYYSEDYINEGENVEN